MVAVSWVELQSLLKTFRAWKGWMSLVRCSVRNERPEDPPGAGRIHQLVIHPLEVKNSEFFTWKKKGGKGRFDPFPIWVGFGNFEKG